VVLRIKTCNQSILWKRKSPRWGANQKPFHWHIRPETYLLHY